MNAGPGPAEVVVVTGAGGMGSAIARRIGNGRTVVIADASSEQLDGLIEALRAEGYAAQGVLTDVSDRASVQKLADVAAGAGRVVAIVHTAGVSAAGAPAHKVFEVDLVGTAHVIDVFESVAGQGTAMVCVASVAGHLASVSAEDERAFATLPAEELLTVGAVVAAGEDSLTAYLVSKRANLVRVQQAALAWNRRGARVNSVSPGVISTAMARIEADSPSGAHMLQMLDACGAGRPGTPAEVADAVAFLTGPESRYVSGTDLILDGGQTAWLRRHQAH